MRRAVLRIVRYIGIFLFLYSLLLWGAFQLAWPWSFIGVGAVFLVFVFSALLVLDITIPQFNLLSPTMERLPKPLAKKSWVALTFDDGPTEPYTREILDVLDRFDAKASFFCVGENVEAHPQLAKEIVERGHTIGNHTQGHRILPFLSPKEAGEEIKQGGQTLASATGIQPKFLRCPKGYKSPWIVNLARRLGYEVIGFSYPIFDVQNPAPKKLVDRVLQKVSAGDIILMHDGFVSRKPGARDSLVKALPQILEGLKTRGLTPVSLDQALGS